MGDLLTPLKTRSTTSHDVLIEPLIEERRATKAITNAVQVIESPEEALEALSSQPDHGTLIKTLEYLNPDTSEFKVKLPGPKATQLINILVANIIPDYWSVLDNGRASLKSKNAQQRTTEQDLLLECLRSVAGLGAILAQLRSFTALFRNGADKTAISGIWQSLRCLLSVLAAILEKETFLFKIWTDINALVMKPIQRNLLWKEVGSLIASGKIPSISAEAIDISKAESKTVEEDSWLANTRTYSEWLGSNIVFMASKIALDHEDSWTALAQVLGKSYGLGYTGMLTIYVKYLFAENILQIIL